jgi:hypothetical protein
MADSTVMDANGSARHSHLVDKKELSRFGLSGAGASLDEKN